MNVIDQAQGENWTLYQGDCVQVMAGLPDNSVDFCIHSPPFSQLYIYSDSEADMGNCESDEEFFAHYRYVIRELYRVTVPGRLCAVHCKDLPAFENRDGARGLKDFPGEIIRAFEAEGWQYHSRVMIWKDPVIEMQRTKNHGLLHKNFKGTASGGAEGCRQGMPDYLVVFRKWPVEGGKPVYHNLEIGHYVGEQPPEPWEYQYRGRRSPKDKYSIAVWQRYASSCWLDINQMRVLNYTQAKDGKDEKHICPLQLDVIARCIDLWTNPGDVVLDPFNGIGSAGYEALRMHRKYVGIELKDTYFRAAQKHLREAEQLASQVDLFQWAGVEVEEALP